MTKKLLQINSVANSGSTGKIAEQIGKCVMSHGWQSFITYNIKANESKSHLIKVGAWWNRPLHAIEARFFDNVGLGSRIATRRLLKKLDKIKPDVIQIHLLHGYYINYPMLFRYIKKHQIPVVWTFHDCWALTGHCVYFDMIGCDKWKNGCKQCSYKSTYPKSIFLNKSEKNYQLKKECFTCIDKLKVVTVSDWLKRIVELSMFSNREIIRIYNGVDLSLFRPYNIMSLFGKKKILLTVGSIWEDRRKGFLDYIRLAKILSEEYLIVMVGIPPKKYQKYIPQNLKVVGYTNNQQELVDLYNIADILLNLSYEETMGMTTVEALACGTPCVVYDRTASPELVDKETGVVVHAGAIEEVKNAVEFIDGKGKQFYSKACRRRAELLFNDGINYEDYFRIYEKLLSY